MHHIEAPVSGRILALNLQVGTRVRAGDTVATIESMKMEIPVEAEQDGVVSALQVQVDEDIEEGQPIATLGPAA